LRVGGLTKNNLVTGGGGEHTYIYHNTNIVYP
jgi:hypothetical protein